jgi:6-pyruvoyltetrahydropterin/6-carboxytetrahydropterin synthase
MGGRKMKVGISRTFTFDSAHFLPGYQGPCSRMHGHTWTMKVSILMDHIYFKEKLGGQFIMDFKVFKESINAILDNYDHHILNDKLPPGFYPSAENIAYYFCKVLHEEFQEDFSFPFGVRIELQEGDGGTAIAYHHF